VLERIVREVNGSVRVVHELEEVVRRAKLVDERAFVVRDHLVDGHVQIRSVAVARVRLLLERGATTDGQQESCRAQVS
jgi:hypothetical protein